MANTTSDSQRSSSLDDLRTVEFRQAVRGYKTDDVDAYLERVAVEAEALKEQSSQSNDRAKQAADRIAQLEQTVQELQKQSRPESHQAEISDDTLQRTLILAQRFVDQTQAEAEAGAKAKVAEAEARASKIMREAEEHARTLTDETERQLQQEIARLEAIRSQLTDNVETVARHMESERGRLRSALGEMLCWVDEHVGPAASVLAQPLADPQHRSERSGGWSSTGEGASAWRVGDSTADVR
jgi:cell division initiation protein